MSNVEKWLEDRTILKVYRGSHAYGTNHEDSDVDLGGVCIPPADYIIGLRNFEQWESKSYTNFPAYRKSKQPAEITIYGIHKFFRLAFNCNPNVIEYLFTAKNHILKCTELGQILLANRELFLSKRVRYTFGGYAFSQLQRMTRKSNNRHRGSHKNIIEEYGYDVKHALHLIRLLNMGLEILVSGECNVLRPDNNYLLAIRHGEYTLEQVKEEAERKFKLLDEAYVNSKLPHAPDEDKINELLCEMTLTSFEEFGLLEQERTGPNYV